MRPRHQQTPPPSSREAVSQGLAGLSLVGIGAALGAVLMSGPAVWARGLGVICEHGGSLAVIHCPGCYAAVGLMVGGLAIAANAVALSRRPALAKAPTPRR